MRPCLVLSDCPSYSTPFIEDPWGPDGDSPKSDASSAEYRFTQDSNRSSRTSSTCSHVLPESAFLVGHSGDYLVDPYFGQKELALLCSSYLNKAFNSVEETESSKRAGQPSLSVFIAQLIHLTGLPLKIVGAALILLQRYLTKLEGNKANMTLSGHRLFIGALMLACSDDHLQSLSVGRCSARSAAYWSDISLYSENELDEIFNHLYDELDGNVVVFPSYAAALEKLNNTKSLKSFEVDLNAFVNSSESSDSIAESNSSSESLDSDERHRHQMEEKKGSVAATKKSRNESSVRTRIVSLFTAKKSKS